MDVKEEVLKYKERIKTSSDDIDKQKQALKRLRKLPITLELLAETGVGKTVNKLQSDSKLGKYAHELVEIWRNLIPEKKAKTDPKQAFTSSGASFIDALSSGDKVRKNGLKKHKQPTESDWETVLPKTDPNYRPSKRLPINFEPVPVEEKKRKVAAQNDDTNSLANFVTTKHTKTNVFSGRRKAITYTHVPSLYDICMTVISNNIDAIEDTGDIPFEILKPAMEKATPGQLFYIEERNPYLMEDSDYLWQRHCERKFRSEKPESEESWRELYQRMLSSREERLKTIAKTISTNQKATAVPVRTTKLALAKAPRNIQRKQDKYGTGVRPNNMMDAKELSAARRHITDQPKSFRAQLKSSVIEEQKKKFTPTVAPMMKKSLSMLKRSKRR